MLKRQTAPSTESIPTQCNTPFLQALIQQPGKMEEFLGTGDIKTKLDAIAAYVGSAGNSPLEADLQRVGQDTEVRLNTMLATATQMQETLQQVYDCMQQTILNKQAKMAKIYDLQMELGNKEQEAEEKEAIAATAEQRSETVKDPYTKTNRWEGWFPLYRPMRQTSIPVLIAISVFLLIVSVGMFLRLASIELHWSFAGLGETVSSYGASLNRGVL